jgi:hypothetical protein
LFQFKGLRPLLLISPLRGFMISFFISPFQGLFHIPILFQRASTFAAGFATSWLHDFFLLFRPFRARCNILVSILRPLLLVSPLRGFMISFFYFALSGLVVKFLFQFKGLRPLLLISPLRGFLISFFISPFQGSL